MIQNTNNTAIMEIVIVEVSVHVPYALHCAACPYIQYVWEYRTDANHFEV